MKYTVIEAAKVVGITRQTIYRHIDKKPITTEKDEEGNIFIDASELIRIYGNDINFEVLENNSDSKDTSNSNSNTLQAVTRNDTSSDLRVIEERLNSATKQIDMLESQMRRESEIMEEQIITLKDALKTSQEVQNKTVALLEDKTKRSSNNNNDDWKKSIKSLEDKIANQEKSTKEKAEKEAEEKNEFQKKLEEKEAQLKEQQEALELEQSKSFLHKLFGK